MEWINAKVDLPDNDVDCLIRVVHMGVLPPGEKRFRQTLTGYIQEKSHEGLNGAIISEREWVVHIATNQHRKWFLLNGGQLNEYRVVTHWKLLDTAPEDETDDA